MSRCEGDAKSGCGDIGVQMATERHRRDGQALSRACRPSPIRGRTLSGAGGKVEGRLPRWCGDCGVRWGFAEGNAG